MTELKIIILQTKNPEKFAGEAGKAGNGR